MWRKRFALCYRYCNIYLAVSSAKFEFCFSQCFANKIPITFIYIYHPDIIMVLQMSAKSHCLFISSESHSRSSSLNPLCPPPHYHKHFLSAPFDPNVGVQEGLLYTIYTTPIIYHSNIFVKYGRPLYNAGYSFQFVILATRLLVDSPHEDMTYRDVGENTIPSEAAEFTQILSSLLAHPTNTPRIRLASSALNPKTRTSSISRDTTVETRPETRYSEEIFPNLG